MPGAPILPDGFPAGVHFAAQPIDAPDLEIIEGSTQIHEWLLAREALAGAWELPGDRPA